MIFFLKQGARPGREAHQRVSVGPALTHGAQSDTVQKNFMEPPCCGPITHRHRHLGLMHSHGLVITNTILEQRVIQYLVREQLRPKIDNSAVICHETVDILKVSWIDGEGDCKLKLLERVNLECLSHASQVVMHPRGGWGYGIQEENTQSSG